MGALVFALAPGGFLIGIWLPEMTFSKLLSLSVRNVRVGCKKSCRDTKFLGKGDDTLPRHRVELSVGRDGDGVPPSRAGVEAVVLHRDESDGVAQHLESVFLSHLKASKPSMFYRVTLRFLTRYTTATVQPLLT